MGRHLPTSINMLKPPAGYLDQKMAGWSSGTPGKKVKMIMALKFLLVKFGSD